MSQTNPLLRPWTGAFDLPPFDAISDDDFGPAFETTLAEARAAVDAIADNPEPATIENTLDALELADAGLNRVLGVFFNLSGADSNPAREALMREISPKLSAYGSDITMNRALFARIEDLWQRKDSLGLTPEQARVLMLTRRSFVRAGAALEPGKQARLKEVKQRLAVLSTQFTQNLLADERGWYMELTEADLEGLPDFVIASARAAGEEKGAPGPVVTLSRSLIVPFLQFSPRRDLRETAYEAWTSRGAGGGETDNRALAAESLALRQERAELLGYANFAEYKLETEMAKTPAAVRELLAAVWKPARAQAEADAQVLEARMHADGINGALEAWDWRYYSEARRKEEHDLDEAVLKPYLQLDRMIEAAFDLRGPPVRAELHADRRAGLSPRRPRLGGEEGRPAHGACSSAIISPAGPSGRVPGVRPCATRRSWAARCGPSSSTSATSPSRRRASRRCCATTMRARCSTSSAMRCTSCCPT